MAHCGRNYLKQKNVEYAYIPNIMKINYRNFAHEVKFENLLLLDS